MTFIVIILCILVFYVLPVILTHLYYCHQFKEAGRIGHTIGDVYDWMTYSTDLYVFPLILWFPFVNIGVLLWNMLSIIIDKIRDIKIS